MTFSRRGFTNCYSSLVFVVVLLLCTINLNRYYVKAYNVDHYSNISCEKVKPFFDSLKLSSGPHYHQRADSTGTICAGHCCDNSTELELITKSTNNFERLLRHHTSSLRGILETTGISFKEHVLELSQQSENKTLILFSQVYRRMAPLSRKPILTFYENIRSHISAKHNTENIEKAVNDFFTQLFPVAYHHAVHAISDTNNGDFHVDYKNCLMHTFEELQPFGNIPKLLSKNLVQSVGIASVFIKTVDRAASILAKTEELNTHFLSSKCKQHLLKMNFCPECNGVTKQTVKTCSSYCLNVIRGCLAQYTESLDGPWAGFAGSIVRLTNLIRTKEGIESVIKTLDGKLSEAIMHAMENGPQLEKRVKRACGLPSLLSAETIIKNDDITSTTVPHKWISPSDTEMLHFIVTIDRSKELYSKIVNSLCEDDEYKKDDRNCWTGDHVGEYSQSVLPTSVSSQKYNPEVPFQTVNDRPSELYQLSDKLVELKRTVTNSITQFSIHSSDTEKMQSDMAEEGSGAWSDDNINNDDEEYSDFSGSGDSTDHTHIVDVNNINRNVESSNAIDKAGGASVIRISSYMLTLVFITQAFIVRRL